MMHYRKGENVEKQLTKEQLPFEDFLAKDTEFLWMHVNGGTKVNNVLSYAKNALDKGQFKHIVWSGNGGGVVKTISCAEILKRSYPLYQVTRTCYTTVAEHWMPQMEGLEEIVANRQIPSLHIFMSLEPIDDKVKGLQKPNTKTDFWDYNSNSRNTAGSSNNNINKSNNQGQRRPKPNQNRNYQRQQDKNNQENAMNTSANQDVSNGPSSSSNGNQQRKFNNNHQKRKRPTHDRDTQNTQQNVDNSNRVESMET